MSWCFATVNGRLAEIFFEREEDGKEPEIMGHCYVSVNEYTTKKEKEWIKKDTRRYTFSYRNRVYRDKIRKKLLKRSNLLEKRSRHVPSK